MLLVQNGAVFPPRPLILSFDMKELLNKTAESHTLWTITRLNGGRDLVRNETNWKGSTGKKILDGDSDKVSSLKINCCQFYFQLHYSPGGYFTIKYGNFKFITTVYQIIQNMLSMLSIFQHYSDLNWVAFWMFITGSFLMWTQWDISVSYITDNIFPHILGWNVASWLGFKPFSLYLFYLSSDSTSETLRQKNGKLHIVKTNKKKQNKKSLTVANGLHRSESRISILAEGQRVQPQTGWL